MRYLGFFVIIFAAAILSREYARHMERRLAECEGFLRFFEHMRIKVSSFLSSPKELCTDFDFGALHKVGFADALRSSSDTLSAYKQISGALSLSDAEKKIVEELFSSVGSCYRTDAVRLIEAAEEKMSRVRDELAATLPKSVRLVTSLAVTGAIGIVIFFV